MKKLNKSNTVEPRQYGHQWAKKLALLTGDRINDGFFLQGNVWRFCQAAKNSGRNNEVAVRRGFTAHTPNKY